MHDPSGRKRLSGLVVVWLVVVLSVSVSAQVLEIWAPSPALVATLERHAAQFEAMHPGVRVQVMPITWNDFNDKVPVAFATNEAPDILMAGSAFIYDMVNLNFATPIDQWTRTWDGLGDYAPGLLRTMTYEGELYGLPVIGPTRALWYRKDLFREHGLDAENPPEMWSDIRDAARRIVRFDGDRVNRIGFQTPGDMLQHAFLTNGVSMFSEDLTRTTVRSPEALEALTFWGELGREMLYVGRERTFANTNIYTGQAGMIYGYAVAHQMSNIDESLFDVVAGPVTIRNNVKAGHVYPDWLMVTSQAKNPDLAWEFLKWVSTPDLLADLSMASGHPAPRRAAYDHPFFETRDGQFIINIFLEATLPYGTNMPFFPDRIAIQQARDGALSAVINGEMSPEAALDRLELQFNNILARIAEQQR